MVEKLGVSEAKARFPNQWLLLENLEFDEASNVVAGTVLYHSPDRDEFDKKVIVLSPKTSAVLYTGDVPMNVLLAS